MYKIYYKKIVQEYMFSTHDYEQDEDAKPPSFFSLAFQKTNLPSTKIMSCFVKFTSSDSSVIQGQMILYEQYIAAEVEDKTFMFQIELTITFEANSDKKIIKFKDGQRQLYLSVMFQKDSDYERFYNSIKKCLFQTNFEEKYQILRELGSGKTSLVFQVKDKKDGMVYAAKFYSNIPSSIEKQIKILKLLQHPNIIFFHQMYFSKGQIYLIMDYEDGGTLLNKINQECFPTMKEKIKFLLDMLNAFQFLRIMGIVHRDLKPENILFSKKDNCYKIADFALAVYQDESINKLAGTPGYIAPELFQNGNQSRANQYTDIYTLGLIYYQLATKKAYFYGQCVESVLKNNRKAKSIKRKKYSKHHITDTQYQILRMMLRTQPENRRLSLQILQSSEFRTMVKQFALQKRNSTQKSSSSSHNKQSNTKKNSDGSEFQSPVQEEKLMNSMKNILRMKSSI